MILPLFRSYLFRLFYHLQRHFGLIVVFNMMIGLSTPPFGMLLFITSGISGTPLKDVIREIWRPLVAMMLVLLLICSGCGIMSSKSTLRLYRLTKKLTESVTLQMVKSLILALTRIE